MPKEEINVLFAHTRHLREGRARWKKFGILELSAPSRRGSRDAGVLSPPKCTPRKTM
jgi:hypothetical protein